MFYWDCHHLNRIEVKCHNDVGHANKHKRHRISTKTRDNGTLDDILFNFSEIVEILSEKCNLNKDEVRGKYESFQSNYPEGEITKEQFLETMKASEASNILFMI